MAKKTVIVNNIIECDNRLCVHCADDTICNAEHLMLNKSWSGSEDMWKLTCSSYEEVDKPRQKPHFYPKGKSHEKI